MAKQHGTAPARKSSKLEMYTPWGRTTRIRHLASGVYDVGTRNSGGILLANSFARRHLSPPAQERAVQYGPYYAFGYPSGAWAIAAWELTEFRDKLLVGRDLQDEPKTHLLKVLSETQADYLEAQNISPDPARYALWRRRQVQYQMRDQKSGDLIVRLRGTWKTKDSSLMEATTADGEIHIITAKSYWNLDPLLPLLSDCEVHSTVFLPDLMISSSSGPIPLLELDRAEVRRPVRPALATTTPQLDHAMAIVVSAFRALALAQPNTPLAEPTNKTVTLALENLVAVAQAENRKRSTL